MGLNQGRSEMENIFYHSGVEGKQQEWQKGETRGWVDFGPGGFTPSGYNAICDLLLFPFDNKDLSIVIFRFRIYHT